MRMRSKKRLVAELALASALTTVAISNVQVAKPASHRVFAATIAKDSSGVTEWHEWGNKSNPVDWGIDKNGTLWLMCRLGFFPL